MILNCWLGRSFGVADGTAQRAVVRVKISAELVAAGVVIGGGVDGEDNGFSAG